MKTIKVSTQPKADTKRLKVADLQPGTQMDALVAEARVVMVKQDQNP